MCIIRCTAAPWQCGLNFSQTETEATHGENIKRVGIVSFSLHSSQHVTGTLSNVALTVTVFDGHQ